jgi:O-methyltransferase
MYSTLKLAAKRVLRPLLYRFPPVMISPHRLYVWLDVLSRTKNVSGDVLEVGCYLGGTAAVSVRMLDAIGSDRSYTVIDTFSGFDEGQFRNEVRLGANPLLASEFSSNSPELARWVLDRHGGKRVKIVQGDVTRITDDQIPTRISACLLDVDLEEPTYKGLTRLYPRLVAGGIIAVDDCDNFSCKAKMGYERFMAENGFQSEFKYGMGLIAKPS